ncbi:MAG TPA: hypothetical protein VK815_04130 [Candidatus Acidoferrales bacterium]|jgi:hypothetical protein|nr:hypothetical protein [Candidatus Acidoferrales bacterium]
MQIDENILKCVFFIGLESQDGAKTSYEWRGTGFFVSRPSKLARKAFVYLVTAKHIIADIGQRNFVIRVNNKNGDSTIFNVESGITWFFHPDESEASDVAVYPLFHTNAVLKTLDFVAISEESLLTDLKSGQDGIGVGSDVFITGLFAFHSGTERNHPIVRMGNIAMIPTEPVPTKKFGNMEVILIESRSIGGLSGSPVFAVEKSGETPRRLMCLGLIHGHWDVPTDSILETKQEARKYVNVGIAMVAPARKIGETINQPKLEAIRQKMESKEDP